MKLAVIEQTVSHFPPLEGAAEHNMQQRIEVDKMFPQVTKC